MFVIYIMIILCIGVHISSTPICNTRKIWPATLATQLLKRYLHNICCHGNCLQTAVSQCKQCTKTIVGICTSVHENMTAVANDNTEHKAPLDLSTFYIRSWRILSTKCIFSTKCSLSVKMQSGRLVSNSDPPPGLKGSLSMRLSGQSAHVATQQLIKWVILIVQQ